MKNPLCKSALIVLLLCACKGSLHSSDLSSSEGILGGIEVQENNPVASFTVGLYDASNGSRCSGSLIAPDTVLTAAHCASPNADIYVVFSRKFSTSGFVDTSGMRKAKNWKQHEQWNPSQPEGTDTHDLALIHFEGGLPQGYTTVEVNTNDQNNGAEGIVFLAAGYGVSDGLFQIGGGILRQVDLQFRQMHSETEIETVQNRKGVCSGDSGGPLLLLKPDGKYLQVGVASRVATKFLGCRDYAVFTKTSFYKDWIFAKKTTVLSDTESLDNPAEEAPVPKKKISIEIDPLTGEEVQYEEDISIEKNEPTSADETLSETPPEPQKETSAEEPAPSEYPDP
jgi:hypothetical protein